MGSRLEDQDYGFEMVLRCHLEINMETTCDIVMWKDFSPRAFPYPSLTLSLNQVLLLCAAPHAPISTLQQLLRLS